MIASERCDFLGSTAYMSVRLSFYAFELMFTCFVHCMTRRNVSVNGHFLCALFSTSLARKRGHSLSHNIHAEGQTHRQLLWHGGTFF